MKHVLLLALILMGVSSYAMAQDKLITKDGEVINAWSVDIGSSSIYYKTADTDNATIKSISKDKVLLIKKQDGTNINLYEQGLSNKQTEFNPNQPSSNNLSTQTTAPFSVQSQLENDALIKSINSSWPSYVKKDSAKEASRVLCLLGITEDSRLINDEIDIHAETGHIAKYSKKDIYEEVKTDYTCPALVLNIKNKTNKTIYIDLGNSFFSRKNSTQAYYVPTSTSVGQSSSSGAGVNLGSVAGALGVGGTLGTLAGGIGVGRSSGTQTITTTYSQRVIAIPPLSSKFLDPMTLFDKDDLRRTYCEGMAVRSLSQALHKSSGFDAVFSLRDSNGEEFKRGERLYYNEDNSPINFSTIISYSFSEDCSTEYTISAHFYLRGIIGFRKAAGEYIGGCVFLSESIPDYKHSLYFVGFIPSGDTAIRNLELGDDWNKSTFPMH